MKRLAIVSLLAVAALSSPVAAADLYVPEVVIEPELMSWSTCYIGVGIEYSTGTVSSSFPFSNYATNPTGPGISPRAGCDLQIDGSPLVIGVVTDLTLQNQQAMADVVAGPPIQRLTTTMPWEASLRLRAGLAVESTLFYLTGGLAVASISNNLTAIGGTLNETVTNTHIGWTVGGGVETMVTDNISLFAEYRYSDFGTQSYTFPTATGLGGAGDTLSFGAVDHAVKVGVNYRF